MNLSSRASMKGLLSELGMGVAFSQSADFTGLSPMACCIGLAEHAATLRVGEKGTRGRQPERSASSPGQQLLGDVYVEAVR